MPPIQDQAELHTQMGDMRGEMSRMGSDINRMRDELRSEMEQLNTQNQEQRNEMRLEMEQLQSQNQVLLSKISALSSQNSNAPGIFDGADRRKLEAKQKKLLENGQKVAPTVRRRQLAFFDMECEFFKNCSRDCS